jgi:membrane protein
MVFLRTFPGAAAAWWADDCLRLGASLAYYTLFAFAPVLLMAIAIAGFVFGAEAVRGEIVGQIDQLIGKEGALAVQGLLEGASQRGSGVLATVLGAITFLLASTGAFLELQVALNTIWRVKPKPVGQLKAFFINRLRSFGLVVAIGFLMLVSLAVSAALAALNTWLSSLSPANTTLWTIVNLLISMVVTTGLFAMLFRFLPDVRLQWKDVMTGAAATAVLFAIGQQVIGWYLGQSSVASSYGAAGSVMVLLLWVYYSCQIVLFGAEFTRVWAARHGTKVKPEEFAEKDPNAVKPKSALKAVAG